MNAVLKVPEWLQTTQPEKKNNPAWFIAQKQQQWQDFLRVGLPTRHDERWKYTDLTFLTKKDFAAAKPVVADDFSDVVQQHRLQQGDSILLVLVNGQFLPTLSDLHKLPKDVIACDMQTALQTHATMLEPYWSSMIATDQYPFASLNAAMSHEGLFFYVPAHCALAAPIHLLSLVAGDNHFIAHPRHLFILGEQSKLTLLEEYFADKEKTYFLNSVTTVIVEKAAQFEQVKIQNESPHALHMAHYFVQQMQDSDTSFTNFSFGSAFARDEIAVTLLGQGANCRTSGFYHLRYDNQYIDHHLDIDHQAPRSNSEMLYKGILASKSRVVFNGRLHVAKDAQKILAYQANHTLLLNKEAEVYSKPELEIYADDVKCKHGASTGQIDQEALFYLRSRGIEKEAAIEILLQGFADDILQRVTHQGMKMRVEEML